MTESNLAPPISFDAEGQALLKQVLGYYHATLKQSPEALAYLKARHLDHPDAVDRFKLGFSNRTLGLSLPAKAWKAGADIRGRLTKVGILRDSGHEHFTGSLVIPVMDEAGNVVEVYGRKLLDNLRKGTPLHTYLPGPPKGVWNLEAFKESKEIILTKSLIEALTFWCAGYRNVTAAYGVEGFTPDHVEAFKRYGIQRVVIAFDRNEAGDHAAVAVAETLKELGITCFRLQFPLGMDASNIALKRPPASKSLGALIRSAEPMGNGGASERASLPPHPTPTPLPKVETPMRSSAPFDRSKPVGPTKPVTACSALGKPSAALPAPAIAPPDSPVPVPLPSPGDDLPHEIQGQDLILNLNGRGYRIRGWQKPLNPEFLKVNVMVTKHERFHIDTLDLYQAKARTAFVRQASLELCVNEDALKLDLGKVLRKVEALQAEQLAKALAAKDQRPTLTEEEHAQAMTLLESPDLMGRVLQDFDALGVVGEESNKLTGYLAAVSRLLDRPLALLIQSASAAGKSSLMDAVLDFMPEEDLVRYSAMTGQSLFYMGDKNLSHKVLAIAEEEGAKQASYALKLLQSEGMVTMASTGKDPATGMLMTHDYEVEGPVMLFLTTTAIDLDEELLNRCLVLTVDESREQTRAIHTRQRSRETLGSLLAKTERQTLITLHRNAQRLLEPLAVVNPYADQLSFRDDQTRSRRDHLKYLTLIRAIALLHQFQREVKTLTSQGQSLRYLEVIPSDIALANDLAREVLGRNLDDLLPQTRKLLTLLHDWVAAECKRQNLPIADFRFTRRQLREALQWGDTQLKIHLSRLVELELLLVNRGRQGKSYLYELLYQGDDADGRAKLLGLIDCTDLKSTGTTSTSRGSDAHFAGVGRGMVGGRSVGGRGVVEPLKGSPGEVLGSIPATDDEKGTSGVSLSAFPSYAEKHPTSLDEVR